MYHSLQILIFMNNARRLQITTLRSRSLPGGGGVVVMVHWALVLVHAGLAPLLFLRGRAGRGRVQGLPGQVTEHLVKVVLTLTHAGRDQGDVLTSDLGSNYQQEQVISGHTNRMRRMQNKVETVNRSRRNWGSNRLSIKQDKVHVQTVNWKQCSAE